MTITRIVDGKTVEIELTFEEMVLAAEAIKEHNIKVYIRNRIGELDDDDDRAPIKNLPESELAEAIDEMASDFELLVEDDYYDWDEAWNVVSCDYILKMKKGEV